MAFCANCGSEVQGRFCAKCGSPVDTAGQAAPAQAAPAQAAPPPQAGAYTPPPPGQGAPQGAGYAAPPPAQSSGLTDNVAGALCYILTILTGILFLVLEPYNKNRTVRFHAWQAIFFGIATFVLWIAETFLSIVLSNIPVIGFLFSVVIMFALGLGLFILWLMLMYKAYNNERWVLPVIGPLAEKQA
jgi:uncharacterized membrane protein